MKLLVDMNLSPRWVGVLTRKRRRGGALVHGVVMTHDLDFSAILAATHGEKPSVVQLRADDVSPDVLGRQVIIALRQMEADLQEGALITIDSNRTRLRVLPLQRKE